MIFSNRRRRRVAFIAIAFIALVALLLLARNPLLRLIVKEKTSKLEASLGLSFSYGHVQFCGPSSICVSGISALAPDSSMVFYMGQMNASLSFWDMFRFRANPRQVTIDTLFINLSFLAPKEQVRKEQLVSTSSGGQLLPVKGLEKLVRRFIGFSTANMSISMFQLDYQGNGHTFQLKTPLFQSNDGKLSSDITMIDDGTESAITFLGTSDKLGNYLSGTIAAQQQGKVSVPLISSLFQAQSSFSSLKFSLRGKYLDSDSLNLSLTFDIEELEIDNRYISEKPVDIERLGLALGFGLSPNRISFDSTSSFFLNQLNIPFALSASNNGKPHVSLRCNSGNFEASLLFESLPQGLFNSLQGIRVGGEVSFSFMADLDFNRPDSLQFQVELLPHRFRIEHFGVDDFTALNDTFTYVIYENGLAAREIRMDSALNTYSKLGDISDYLKQAVIASEDAGFFYHKGFDLEGIRYAMVQNLHSKRLARGGSTITQQLVKNIYLNRTKNILRKLDEALIVWLIETQRLVPKLKLLEIYFNIIEWGPSVCGPKEACKFYFDKSPNELTLNEALFLTSIIPRPGTVHSSIDSLGNLTPFLFENHLRIARILLERSIISQEEFDGLKPKLNLSKMAIDYLHAKSEAMEANAELEVETETEELE